MAVAIPSSFVQAESGAHSYPEWDSAVQRYRPHWVNVEEVDPHAEEPQFDAGALHGSDRAFQRALAGLCLGCLLYPSPSPLDRTRYRMPSSA